ncbi:hypothetical protein BS17DRAFT_667367, partial [Gyrodon lividus]
AGHYGNGNAASPDDVAQWVGVSIRSDMEKARRLTKSKTCPAWQNGVFAVDESAIPLFAKPNIYGETFYDQKSRYSLNCQLIIMPHNLLIVDYGLGHPGSIHNAYAFQGTHITSQPATLIPCNHWIWADTAYPTETWCVVPFKKLRGGGLS